MNQHHSKQAMAREHGKLKSGWHQDEALNLGPALLQQAQEMGISEDDVNRVVHALATGRASYQDVLGLTSDEMAAMLWRAEERLNAKQPREALKIFLGLTKLNPWEGAYWQGTAMCFHHLQEYGMALGYYNMALATEPSDRISDALRAECLFKLEGKDAALRLLDQVLAKPSTTDAKERAFVDRAREFQRRLRELQA